jgi:hypothetical protein
MRKFNWFDVLVFVAIVVWLLFVSLPAMGEIVKVPKLREVRQRKLAGEIRSRLPRVFLGIEVDRTYVVRPDGMQPDPQNHVSTAHEFVHCMNSWLRHRYQGRVVCYIPGGRALVVRRLNGLTEPGNPLDETCAYTCGAVTCIEMGLPKRRALDSLRRAHTQLQKCFAYVKNGRQRGYPDAEELETFLEQLQAYQEKLTFECLTPRPTEN